MNIFYAVQATGNGHISRAAQILPTLQKYGKVDVFLSGSNATLDPGFEVKYRSKGLSLFYNKCGGLNKKAFIAKNSLVRAYREASQLPLKKYDIIINDFDFITARSAKMKNLPSIQFGHQASFASPQVPRPETRSIIGEYILKKFAPATEYVGLHFEKYDDFILPPVIKEEYLNVKPKDSGHITVYLPSYEDQCLEAIFLKLNTLKFEVFSRETQSVKVHKNITYFPVSNTLFSSSLIHCHGIITGGGFETPSEALFLNKKLLAIPIPGQYEQMCNAAALEKMGASVLWELKVEEFQNTIQKWLDQPALHSKITANNVEETIQMIISKGVKLNEQNIKKVSL